MKSLCSLVVAESVFNSRESGFGCRDAVDTRITTSQRGCQDAQSAEASGVESGRCSGRRRAHTSRRRDGRDGRNLVLLLDPRILVLFLFTQLCALFHRQSLNTIGTYTISRVFFDDNVMPMLRVFLRATRDRKATHAGSTQKSAGLVQSTPTGAGRNMITQPLPRSLCDYTNASCHAAVFQEDQKSTTR